MEVVKFEDEAVCFALLLICELEIKFIANGTVINTKMPIAINTSTREKPFLLRWDFL
jgi:hypothetical protein